MSTYHSFLICDHPKEGFVNVYIDGLIIGQITKADNTFEPDALLKTRNPFGSLEALRDHVLSVMDAVVGKPLLDPPVAECRSSPDAPRITDEGDGLVIWDARPKPVAPPTVAEPARCVVGDAVPKPVCDVCGDSKEQHDEGDYDHAFIGAVFEWPPKVQEPKVKSKIDAMVDAFLAWPLPASVRCDACVLDQGYPHRVGTNLLTAIEARQMFEYALAKADAATSVKPVAKSVKIMVNYYEVELYPKDGEVVLSYEDIVRLAENQDRIENGRSILGPDDELPMLSVVYHHNPKLPFEQMPEGKHGGMLSRGSKSVKATPGMIIHALHTGNA
jgi:hypothetical protein